MTRSYTSEIAAIKARAVASSTLIALLGQNESIFEHTKLDLYGKATASNRPLLPWLVFTFRGVSGTSNSMRPLNASAWAYCDIVLGEKRLLDIAEVLDTLYGATSKFAIDKGELSIPFVSQIVSDASLGGLLAQETRIQFVRRS
jgi:hypothetical protein